VLALPQIPGIRYHDTGNGPQALDDLAGVFEPTHMRITGGEIAMRLWEARIVLDREEECRHCLIEAPAEEMCAAHCKKGHADGRTRAEPQRGLDVLEREVGLTCSQPKIAADLPAACEARVQRQCTIDQCHHRADVLTEIAERRGGIRQDAGVIAGDLEGALGEIDALPTVRLGIFAAAVKKQPHTATAARARAGP